MARLHTIPLLLETLFCMFVTQLCPTVCDVTDYSLPGFSVHRIPQARILEWAAIPSPRDLPDSGIEPGSPALQADPKAMLGIAIWREDFWEVIRVR